MESYIPISFLNDFIFCPRSIYFHQIYQNFESRLYQESVQIRGKASHKSVDSKKYTTKKGVLQSLDIFSIEYSLCGRIDILDTNTKTLRERKKKVVKIYDGYIFQVYAQYYCLIEMGYKIDYIVIYSMNDNKSYKILKPEKNEDMKNKFFKLLEDINSFRLDKPFLQNIKKCKQCIYRHLCDYGELVS